MSTAVATIERQPRSVLVDMANRYGMEPAAFEATVRATVTPANTTREEFAAFLLVAKEYSLNPLTKEIFAFPKRGGGIVPIVSVDGWTSLVNSHPACDGFEFEMEHDDKGELVSCTCRMYRKDRGRPVTVTEYLSECVRPTDPWKMRHRMLRHKAMIQAARYAFGFSGIYDEDEGQKIAEAREPRASVPPPPPPPPPARVPPAPLTPAVREMIASHPDAPKDVADRLRELEGADAAGPDAEWFSALEDAIASAQDAESIEQVWSDLDVAGVCTSEADWSVACAVRRRFEPTWQPGR